MKLLKRAAVGILAGLIGLSAMGLFASAYSYDNNYYFSFTVGDHQKWGYIGSSQYRGTKYVETPWKVNFMTSSEGTGTIMQFFLLNNSWIDYRKYSDYKDVKQGTGDKYFHAYDEANQKDVRIGARNNNYVPNSYTVSGYWDEETAKHDFDDYN